MNRSLLDHLQHVRGYPCVTVLLNTTRGTVLGGDELTTARSLVNEVDQRLAGELDDRRRTTMIQRLNSLIDERTEQRSSLALALCVSDSEAVAVQLGGEVKQRWVVDETFATRDLVADLNRTAAFRVITVSDSQARVLIGDRQRLVEERNDIWPLRRDDDLGDTLWERRISEELGALDSTFHLPTVAAGVRHSVARLLSSDSLDLIGAVSGNHDRTNASHLHSLAWPLVLDWISHGEERAVEQLDAARSARRFAAGIDEVWTLANEGRIDLLVVEKGFSMSAEIDDQGHLHPTTEHGPTITADVVDEAIEAVVRNGGQAVMVPDERLADEGRIAAALRY